MKHQKHYSRSVLSFAFLLSCWLINTPSAKAQWAKSIGGTNAEYGQGITTDAAGNVYIIGNFRGKVDFNPGPATYYLTSSCPCDESNPLKADVFFAKYTKAGALVWARKIGGSGIDDGKSIGVDAGGNVYITGTFEATADFDPLSTTFNITSNGGQDAFLAKYNSAGELIWANKIGGAFFDYGNSLAVSSTGLVTLTGAFAGSVDFDPSAGSIVLDAGGSSDPFFARYDTNGGLVWVKDISGGGESAAQSIFTDAAGSIYLTGNFFGMSDFDPGPGVFSLTGTSAKDPFFAKYNSAGNLIWASGIAGNGDQTGLGITADKAGNVYVTGYFQGTVDFDPGPSVFTLSSPAFFNAYLLKLNSTGAFQWVANIGGPQDDIGFSVAIDAKQNVNVAGYFAGIANFSSTTTLTSLGSTDIFIAAYNPLGKLLFARQDGGATDDWASAMATDAKGFVYVTGYYTGTATFSTGSATTTLTSAGNADVYFAKLKLAARASLEMMATTKRNELVLPQIVSVFPNPANEFLVINTAAFSGNLLLQVYDATGRPMIKKQVMANQQVKLAIANLEKGIYVLHLTDETGKSKSIKWIKQ